MILFLIIVLAKIFVYSEDKYILVYDNEVTYSSDSNKIHVLITDQFKINNDTIYSLRNLSLKNRTDILSKNIISMCDTLDQILSSEMYVMAFQSRYDINFVTIQAWGYDALRQSFLRYKIKGIYNSGKKIFLVVSDNKMFSFVDKIFKKAPNYTMIQVDHITKKKHINCANQQVTFLQQCFMDSIFYPIQYIKNNKVIFKNSLDSIINMILR